MDLRRSLMYISPVKREKVLKEERRKRKIQMRSELPVLDKFQIRRHRLPLYKALVEELIETEYMSSAWFLQQLVEHHEKMRQEHGPDTPVWCRRRLLESSDVLELLFNEFRSAEESNKHGNYAKEFDIMLELAVKFAMDEEDDWWWLGEQILYQCVHCGENYKADGSMREALSRYIMGKFLLEKLKDPFQITQMEYLGKCRKLSRGMKWSARGVLRTKQDTLFVESAKLLLRALLLEAREVKKYDPKKAIHLCKIARKRAIDSCDRGAEAEVLKLMGKCEMDLEDPKSSCESFYRSLVLNLKLNNLKEICEIRILLALSYMKVENYSDALYQLETLLKFAEENGLLIYKGLAYRYLGEIYINKGQPELATPILSEAVDIFVELNDGYNRRRTKNLSAVSGGQEHIAKYIKLIINCGRKGAEGRGYLKQLLVWKDNRTPFWEEGEVEDYIIHYPEIAYGQLDEVTNVLGISLYDEVAPYEEEVTGEDVFLPPPPVLGEGYEEEEIDFESRMLRMHGEFSSDDLDSSSQALNTHYENPDFDYEEEEVDLHQSTVDFTRVLAYAKREEEEVEEEEEFFEEEEILDGIFEEQSEVNIPLDLPKIEAFEGDEEYEESIVHEASTYRTEGEPEDLMLEALEEEEIRE